MSPQETGPLMESGSSLGTFMDCPRLYEMKYIKRLDSPYYAATLGYGSFIHAFVEETWLATLAGGQFILPEVTWAEQSMTFSAALDEISSRLMEASGDSSKTSTETSPPSDQPPSALRPAALTASPLSPAQALSSMETISPIVWRTLLREISRFPEQREAIATDCVLALAVAREWLSYWSHRAGDLGNTSLIPVTPEREWKLPLNMEVYRRNETGGSSASMATLLGKSDGHFRHKHYPGDWLYELKTSGDPSREVYKMRLEQDKQINANLMALSRDGFAAKGVIYDIIWKPAIRRKTERKTMPDETVFEFNQRILEEYRREPERFFERTMVFRSPGDMADHAQDLLEQFRTLYGVRGRGRFYRNTNSCEKYGRLCQFFKLCMSGAPEEEAEHFRVKDRKLPELSLEIQQQENG